MDRRSFLLSTAFSLLTVPARAHERMDNAYVWMPDLSNRKIDFSKEPKRLRKAFYDLTDEELINLCKAVGYMRNNYPLHHPLQWDNFATVHAMHCTEFGPEYPAVHWSWNFLPWHRGYLFSLERILAHILTKQFNVDGDKFALPYWDWTTQKGMPNTKTRIDSGTPSPFFGYDLEQQDMVNGDNLGFDNSALYEGNRGPTVEYAQMSPVWETTEDSKQHIEECLHYMSKEYVSLMLAAPYNQFLGLPATDRKTGQGLLEQGPHNDGHDWIGSRIGKNRTMGTLRSAARDPMFYMHHGCIDYIWSLYKQPQPDPKGEWGVQAYNFFDVDGSLVKLSNQDIIEGVTNITYQPSSVDKVTLTSAKRPLRAIPTKNIVINKNIGKEILSIDLPPDFFGHDALMVDFDINTITNTDKYTIRLKVDEKFVGKINWLDGDSRTYNKEMSHRFSVLLTNIPKNGKTLTFVPPKNNTIDVLLIDISYRPL
jgi:hypothetical protein